MSATLSMLPRIGVMMFRPAGLVKQAWNRASGQLLFHLVSRVETGNESWRSRTSPERCL